MATTFGQFGEYAAKAGQQIGQDIAAVDKTDFAIKMQEYERQLNAEKMALMQRQASAEIAKNMYAITPQATTPEEASAFKRSGVDIEEGSALTPEQKGLLEKLSVGTNRKDIEAAKLQSETAIKNAQMMNEYYKYKYELQGKKDIEQMKIDARMKELELKAQQEKNKPTSPTIAKEISAMTASIQTLDNAISYAKAHPDVTATGAIGKAHAGKQYVLGKIGAAEPGIDTYWSTTLPEITTSFGKSKQVGVMSDRDYARYAKMMPSRVDGYEQHLSKLQAVRDEIFNSLNAKVTEYQNQGVSVKNPLATDKSRKIVKQFYNSLTGQTKYIYNDGTTEIK